ncbi:MAG: TetR/AcrR family transcriptional regulator [Actinomycetales bacterium]|uniref:TetR/AcrR family transcriptional regulator n=1 Tax=uncultured Salinibacterium sp. TaxID=459274 RepID=UPI0030D6FF28|tara:strand:+ start:7479 stop:8054 length:576 start_codon:yes stop_codon:yes gene_type:complete
MNETPTPRSQAKADRREALLAAAASLFAERGFTRVSLEELGAAAGVSGPAVYRHFDGKQDVLAAMLVDASTNLRSGAQRVIEHAATPRAALESLVKFHVNFALGNADVIRVQDRDLDSLAASDQHEVRTLQRSYVELWVGVLSQINPDAATAELRTRAHATFGLINSTPHSGRAGATRAVLERMALAALNA